MLTAQHHEIMAGMYENGCTLEQVGQTFGVTRERVRQIIRTMGVDADAGGATKRAADKQAAASAAREARFQRNHGCSVAEYYSIPYAARMAFLSNKGSAKHVMHTTWSLNLWQWWAIWQDSGRWCQRGKGAGKYAFSRIDRSRGFEPGNVHVVPLRDALAAPRRKSGA